MTTTTTATIGDKTATYRPDVYRPTRIFFLTPWSRQQAESQRLRLEMVTTPHRIAVFRTVYRALRKTGMGTSTARFRVYELIGDTGTIWPGVQQLGGKRETANR